VEDFLAVTTTFARKVDQLDHCHGRFTLVADPSTDAFQSASKPEKGGEFRDEA
jgi:hypothetical protein